MKTVLIAILAIGCWANVVVADSKEPTGQVEELVKRLETGKLEGAFVDFFASSLVAEQKDMQVRAMDGQAKSAFEFYGRPTTYEITETKKIGNSLIQIKWITKHKGETPIFWNSLFYRRNEKWEPLIVFFFDDPIKAGFLQ